MEWHTSPELQIKCKFTKQLFLPHIPRWSMVMRFQAQLLRAAAVTSGAKPRSLCSAPHLSIAAFQGRGAGLFCG